MEQEMKIVVFVYYPIKAIKPCFEDSLYRYMFDNVWAYVGAEVDEAITVMNEYNLPGDRPINVVRYQFGDIYTAEEKKDEIGELINENFNKWLAMNSNIEESVFA